MEHKPRDTADFHVASVSGKLIQPARECSDGYRYRIIRKILFDIRHGQDILPAAHENGEHHAAVYGLLCGMAIMAISLELF